MNWLVALHRLRIREQGEGRGTAGEAVAWDGLIPLHLPLITASSPSTRRQSHAQGIVGWGLEWDRLLLFWTEG